MNDGKLEKIDRFEEIPLRLAEGILEGIATKPEQFLILGMGFYVGYKGFDLMTYLKDALTGAIGSPSAQAALRARVEIEKMFIIPGYPIETALKFLGLEAPKPEGTYSSINPYYVADPSIVPYTTGETPKEIIADPTDSDMMKSAKIWMHDLDSRLVLGCLGALTAAAITTPGFFSGIGEIVKGVGEIVPG